MRIDSVRHRSIAKPASKPAKAVESEPQTQPAKKSIDHLSLPPNNRHDWNEGQAKWIKQLRNIALPLILRRDYEGLENVPTEDAYIIAPTHQSYLDAVLASELPGDRPFGSMAAVEEFKGPIGKMMSAMGTFPVDRYKEHDGDFADPVTHSAEILDNGNPLVMYPEGRIYADDQVYPLKSGLGRVAINSKAKYALPVAKAFVKDTESRLGETLIGGLLSISAAAGVYAALQGATGLVAGIAAGITGALGAGATYHMTNRTVAKMKVGEPIALEPFRQRAEASDDPNAKWIEANKITSEHHSALSTLKKDITGTEQKFKMDQSGNEWGLQEDGAWVRVERNDNKEWVPIS